MRLLRRLRPPATFWHPILPAAAAFLITLLLWSFAASRGLAPPPPDLPDFSSDAFREPTDEERALQECCAGSAEVTVDVLPGPEGLRVRYTLVPRLPDSLVWRMQREISRYRADTAYQISPPMNDFFQRMGISFPDERGSYPPFGPVRVGYDWLSFDSLTFQGTVHSAVLVATSELYPWARYADTDSGQNQVVVDRATFDGIGSGVVNVHAPAQRVLPLTAPPLQVAEGLTRFSFPADSLVLVVLRGADIAAAPVAASAGEWEEEAEKDGSAGNDAPPGLRMVRTVWGMALIVGWVLLPGILMARVVSRVRAPVLGPGGEAAARNAAYLAAVLAAVSASLLAAGVVLEWSLAAAGSLAYAGSWVFLYFAPAVTLARHAAREGRGVGTRWVRVLRLVALVLWLGLGAVAVALPGSPGSMAAGVGAFTVVGAWLGLEISRRAAGAAAAALALVVAAVPAVPVYSLLAANAPWPELVMRGVVVLCAVPFVVGAFLLSLPWVAAGWHALVGTAPPPRLRAGLLTAAIAVLALSVGEEASSGAVVLVLLPATLWVVALSAVLCALVAGFTDRPRGMQRRNARMAVLLLVYVAVTRVNPVGGALADLPAAALAMLGVWFVALRPAGTAGVFRAEDARDAVLHRIRAHDCRSAARVLRNRMRKGEVSYPEYLAGMAEIEADLARLESSAPQHRPLAGGPPVPAIQRGRTGLLYGAAVGVPWAAVVTARETLAEDPPGLLSAVDTLVNAALPFLVFGVLFGALFPLLRGRDGVQKSLWMFAAVTTPGVLLWVLTGGGGEGGWIEALLPIPALLALFLVLGLLAGDYQTLRHAGLRLRHLVDVHALGVVLTWGATLVLAVVAAVGAITQAGVAEAAGALGSLLPPGLGAFVGR